MKKPQLSLICLMLVLAVATQCSLKRQRIRLFDSKQRKNVFGGNSVVSSYGKFQYHELKNTLEEILDTPQSHRIFSISLLNIISSVETKQRFVEENFYNEWPGRPNEAVVDRTPSYYHSFPIMGSFISPEYIPSPLLSLILKYYKNLCIGDDLNKIFAVMEVELSYRPYSNIYVHSYEGFDRVSCVMGAYQMKYLNKSLKDVMAQTIEFYKSQGKHDGMSFRFYNQLQWYCLSLNRSKQECLFGINGNDPKSYQL